VAANVLGQLWTDAYVRVVVGYVSAVVAANVCDVVP
jgi:hypothetical protein